MEQKSKEISMAEIKDKLQEATGDSKKSQLTIQSVEFVEDVDAFMDRPENGSEAQIVLKRMEESYSRMKIIEANNVGTKRRYILLLIRELIELGSGVRVPKFKYIVN